MQRGAAEVAIPIFAAHATQSRARCPGAHSPRGIPHIARQTLQPADAESPQPTYGLTSTLRAAS
eukprot:1965064-Pyramimonas_sp.AAC.1